MKRVWIACGLVSLNGCGMHSSGQAVSQGVAMDAAVPEVGRPVWVQASGFEVRERPCGRSPCRERHFWVKIAAGQELDSAGIVWSDDGGRSQRSSVGESAEAGGKLWLVNAVSASPGDDVVFSVFGMRHGQRVEDPAGNHHLERGVSAEVPVRITGVGFHDPAPRSVRVTANVETFSFLAPGTLNMTISEGKGELACALGEGRNWLCEGVLEGISVGQGEAVLNARYRVGAAEFRDVARVPLGARATLALSPLGVEREVGDAAVAGNLIFLCRFSEPVEKVQMRLDGGDWVAGDFLPVSTAPLRDGFHQVECVGNPGQGVLESRALRLFRIKNPWDLLSGETIPTALPSGEQRLSGVLAWAEPGRALVLFGHPEGERHLVLWNVQTREIERHYALPAKEMVTSVAAYEERVVGLDTEGGRLWLWEGEGDGRALPLPPSLLSGRRLVNLTKEVIFVTSPWQGRVFAFGVGGGDVQELSLRDADCPARSGMASATAGDSLWIICGQSLRAFGIASGAFRETQRVTLSQPVHEPVALTRDGQGRFWIADAAPARVLRADGTGRVETGWYSSGRKAVGDFGTPSALAAGPDGSLHLGTAFEGEVFRFQAR